MRDRFQPGFVVLLATALAGASDIAMAAPVTFNTALPVARGASIFRQQIVVIDRGDDPSDSDRNLTVVGSATVAAYGLTGRLALFGALPYFDKRLESNTPGGDRVARSVRGIGDARAFVRYTAFTDDAPGRTLRIASFAGIEAPTGDDDARDSSGVLPPTLQPGSGSWDPFFGLVGTWQTLDYQIDGQIGYELNTRGANGFEFGDVFRADASLQYRLLPRELGNGIPGFLYGIVEANLSHQARNAFRGTEDFNSGGTSLFLSPGLQYVTRRWIIEGVIQLPVFQDLNGTALEDDFTVRAGFRFNF